MKGKLFEDQYTAWLNHGHLPAGLHAEMAHSATQPGWDIAIKDHAGHVDQVLQLKASSDVAYVHAALQAHPNIDVVVPHDVYARMAEHGEFSGHLLDSSQNLHALGGHVGAAVDHATAADAAFHIPVLAVAFAVGHSYYTYRAGHITLHEALRSATERSILSVVATGLGYAAGVAAHSNLVTIPVAIAARIMGARVWRNLRLREQWEASSRRCGDSARVLEAQFRPALA